MVLGDADGASLALAGLVGGICLEMRLLHEIRSLGWSPPEIVGLLPAPALGDETEYQRACRN